jgi:hypothetical protein
MGGGGTKRGVDQGSQESGEWEEVDGRVEMRVEVRVQERLEVRVQERLEEERRVCEDKGGYEGEEGGGERRNEKREGTMGNESLEAPSLLPPQCFRQR